MKHRIFLRAALWAIVHFSVSAGLIQNVSAANQRVLDGYYMFHPLPQNEGISEEDKAIPVVLRTGKLSDGDIKKTGQAVTYKGTSTAPLNLSVVIDLQRDIPLSHVDVCSKAANKWWGLQAVTVSYRSSETAYYRQAGRITYSALQPVMSFALKGEKARYVRVELRRPDNYFNVSLDEVAIYTTDSPEAKLSVLPTVDEAEKMLQREVNINARMVDRYGQFLYEDWPGKIKSESQLKDDLRIDAEQLAKSDYDPTKFDKYGGYKNMPGGKATGFFHLEKLDGRWWFITPQGNRFILLGIDDLTYTAWCYQTPIKKKNGESREAFEELPALPDFKPAYFYPDRVSFPVANVMRKYGDNHDAKWVDAMLRRMQDWGFNATAKWTRHSTLQAPFITVLWPKNRKKIKWASDPFEPGFARAVEDGVQKECEKQRDNPWLIGHTFENEAGWNKEVFLAALASDETCAGKKSIIQDLLDRNNNDVAKVAALLGVNAESKEELNRIKIEKPLLTNEYISEFIQKASALYFRIVRDAIKKFDPNHAFLGASLTPDWQSSLAWEIGGTEYLDAITIDYYTLDTKWIQRYEKLDKPVMLLEFSFSVVGRGMSAWGAPIKDQKSRGLAYRNVVENLLAHPSVVGFGWYILYDSPVTGRTLGGEFFNQGLLNSADQPYTEMIDEMRKTNRRAYDLHAGKVPPVYFENLLQK